MMMMGMMDGNDAPLFHDHMALAYAAVTMGPGKGRIQRNAPGRNLYINVDIERSQSGRG